MLELLITLVVGSAAALVAGMLSGVVIGGEAIGKGVAAAMGGLYGLLSGGAAVLVGLIVLALVQGGM